MDVIQKGRDWFQQSIKGISNVYSLREGERIPLKKDRNRWETEALWYV